MIMKKFFCLLMASIAVSFMSCTDESDANFIQGIWAMYENGTSNIENGSSGNFVVWVIDANQIHQQSLYGIYKDGVISGFEDSSMKVDISYNYTYRKGKLSYNDAEASVTIEDNDHITLAGMTHWTRLKDVEILKGYYNNPDRINLNNYDPYADSSCWAITCYSGTASTTEYTWSNEYWVAAGCKLALEMLQGTDIAYSWHAVAASDEADCNAKNVN